MDTRQRCYRFLTTVAVFVIGTAALVYVHLPTYAENAQTCDMVRDCVVAAFDGTPTLLKELKMGSYEAPKPPAVAQRKVSGRTVVDYVILPNGNISADFNEFKSQVYETLNDQRGWARMGVVFNPVSSGGAFTVYLSEAAAVVNFSPTVCDSTYSCQIGSNVIINQDRWLNGTEAWNAAGGSLRDYRHMVVNHEVGHWLEHPHLNCGGVGQRAPVMRQQSIDLQGCTFNPWPLDSELWSSRLGI